jgi:hypothetical protein
MSSLDDVETRLRVLLDRYRPDLVDGTIYGMPSLTWPGAKAHDYFAAVKRGATFVSLYLLVADTTPTPWTTRPRRCSRGAPARRPSDSSRSTTSWARTSPPSSPGSTTATGPTTLPRTSPAPG